MATTNRLDALRLRLVAGETAQEIGARIRARRKELGLNQRQLADLIPEPSVGNQRISDWERGVHQPTPRYLRLLGTALDVEIAYFYGASAEGPATPDLMKSLRPARDEELAARLDDLQEAVDRIEGYLQEQASKAVRDRVRRAAQQQRRRRGEPPEDQAAADG